MDASDSVFRSRLLFAIVPAVYFVLILVTSADAEVPDRRIAPIAVENGRAVFQMKSTGPGDSTRIVVSSLSRRAGPFPVRIIARPTTHSLPRQSAKVIVEMPQTPRLAQNPSASLPRELEPLGSPTRERFFYLLARDGDPTVAGNYDQAKGILRAYQNRIEVYVDEHDLDRVSAEVLRDIVETFGRKILPTAAATIGKARDVDGDGRFLVFMTSRLSRIAGGRYSIDGFVRSADFRPSLPAPFGNRADMLCLNSNLAAGPRLRSILAHEYAHAVTTTARSSAESNGETEEEESWLDEGIAHAFERYNGFSAANLDYRVSAFLSRPEEYRLVVKDYFADKMFRRHGCRGSAYLFIQSLVDHYGIGILRELVRCNVRGTHCVESAVGKPFDALFREWTTELALGRLEPTKQAETQALSIPCDLLGRFGDWPLAGPNHKRIEVGEPAFTVSLVGTSSCFFEVQENDASLIEIEIEGPAEADLQLTMIEQARNLPRLNMAIDLVPSSDPQPKVQIRLKEGAGRSVRINRISWEPLVPEHDPQIARFSRDELVGNALRGVFSADRMQAGSQIVSKPIALNGVQFGDAPLVFKLVADDDRGRRVTAWATFNPMKSSIARAKSDHSAKK